MLCEQEGALHRRGCTWGPFSRATNRVACACLLQLPRHAGPAALGDEYDASFHPIAMILGVHARAQEQGGTPTRHVTAELEDLTRSLWMYLRAQPVSALEPASRALRLAWAELDAPARHLALRHRVGLGRRWRRRRAELTCWVWVSRDALELSFPQGLWITAGGQVLRAGRGEAAICEVPVRVYEAVQARWSEVGGEGIQVCPGQLDAAGPLVDEDVLEVALELWTAAASGDQPLTPGEALELAAAVCAGQDVEVGG